MNIKDVENLAELARINLSIEEKQKILKDMEGILDYVKQIESVEILNSDKNNSKIDSVYNVWREDERSQNDFFPELIKEQFPDSQDGFLKVKKIL